LILSFSKSMPVLIDLPDSLPASAASRSETPPVFPTGDLELLLCCARTHISESIAQRIQMLCDSDVDWPELVQKASQHGVLPLLFRSLKVVCPEKVPTDIRQQLQTFYRQNGARNLKFTGELIQLLNCLQAQGFEAVSFKGPSLAIAAYGDLGLRSFGDLDILVRAEDYLPVRDYLLEQGYESSILLWHFSKAEEETYLEWLGECPLMHPQRGVMIEIHQRLIAGFLFQLSASFDDFWHRIEPVSLLGRPTMSLQPEDLLLYLCIHGTKDYWKRLSWVCDISELIGRHPAMQWQDVLQQAKEHGSTRMLLLGLSLAHQVLGTSLPLEIHQSIQADGTLQQLSDRIIQQLYGLGAEELATASSVSQFWFHFQAMDTARDRIRHTLRYLTQWTLVPWRNRVKPTAKDRLFCPLPNSLYFLYYFIRPVRLIKEWWQSAQLDADLYL
jgi:hypothetical protein